MSTTVIEIIQDEQGHSAQPSQATLAKGDTIKFSNSAGEDVLLVFSPAAITLLSTQDGSGPVDLAGGSSTSFQVGEVGQGPYVCQILPAGSDTSSLTWPNGSREPVLLIVTGVSLEGFAEVTEVGEISPRVDR